MPCRMRAPQHLLVVDSSINASHYPCSELLTLHINHCVLMVYYRQVPNSGFSPGVSGSQGERDEGHHQVPAEEGAVHGCRSGQPVDGGEADPAEHPAERQLPGLPAQEELAERECR